LSRQYIPKVFQAATRRARSRAASFPKKYMSLDPSAQQSRSLKDEGYKRNDRIADLLQRETAYLLQREMKDPRLRGLITVSAVTLSKDLAHAKVYITQLDTERPEVESIQNTLKILNAARGHLRTELAGRLKLRIMPELTFLYDDSVSRSAHLNRLIDDAGG
jgi:ribosome-binding factor A